MNAISLSFIRSADVVRLADENAIDSYEQATVRFENGGSRAELFRSLFSLGIPAEIIKWHGENPGRRMCAVCYHYEGRKR